MKRHSTPERKNWQSIVESQGLTFHSRTAPYWNDAACYEFTSREIDTLEAAANNVHELCLKAAQHIIDNDLFEKMAIPAHAAEIIKNSWNADQLHLYGRFDFAYDGIHAPKMLEYNADTPTSLLEASVIQWYWLKDTHSGADQFNSLHEQLIERWKEMRIKDPIYFATIQENEEDMLTTEYLRDTASQASLKTSFIDIGDIGYRDGKYVDLQDKNIPALFKLYPWEWLTHEEFGQYLSTAQTRFIEPAWKMLWSNKAILPILWELAPNHPNLLEASFEPLDGEYVKKPFLSREGANVEIFDGASTFVTSGEYGEEGHIYQRYVPIKTFDGKTPVLGLWMIGDYCRGMGIRESEGPITGNLSKFTPHYFR